MPRVLASVASNRKLNKPFVCVDREQNMNCTGVAVRQVVWSILLAACIWALAREVQMGNLHETQVRATASWI